MTVTSSPPSSGSSSTTPPVYRSKTALERAEIRRVAGVKRLLRLEYRYKDPGSRPAQAMLRPNKLDPTTWLLWDTFHNMRMLTLTMQRAERISPGLYEFQVVEQAPPRTGRRVDKK